MFLFSEKRKVLSHSTVLTSSGYVMTSSPLSYLLIPFCLPIPRTSSYGTNEISSITSGEPTCQTCQKKVHIFLGNGFFCSSSSFLHRAPCTASELSHSMHLSKPKHKTNYVISHHNDVIKQPTGIHMTSSMPEVESKRNRKSKSKKKHHDDVIARHRTCTVEAYATARSPR